MSTGNTSTAPTIPQRQRPAWRTALVALVILFVLSEAAYLLVGFGAKDCSDVASGCRHIVSWLYENFIIYAVNDLGMRVMVVKTSFALPGFNNFFYLILGNVLTDEPVQFLATMAASLLVGFLALWGYLATSADRGAPMKLLLAIVFAIGWFVVYNNTEASVYRVDFFATASQRYAEIPVTFFSLLIVSFFARRRKPPH